MDEVAIRLLLVCSGLILFAIAAGQDLAFRLVSNRLPLTICAVGVALHLLDGDVLTAVGLSLLVFLAAAFCWRRGWLGGADVKLFGAGTMLVAPGAVGTFLLDTSLAGGVLAAAYWGASRVVHRPSSARPPGLLQRIARVERRRLHQGGPLPYAVALSAGACLAITGG